MSDLFTPAEELDRQQAIRDFLREFRKLLRTARTRVEKRELKRAIRSYEAQLDPPKPCRAR